MAARQQQQHPKSVELGPTVATSLPAAAAPSRAQPPASQQALFIDAVTGRHISPDGPAPLLARRRLTWAPAHGWTYDAWMDDPAAHALAGANSRFSLPAIAGRVRDLLADAGGPAFSAVSGGLAGAWGGLAGGLQHRRHQHQQQQQQQQQREHQQQQQQQQPTTSGGPR